MKEYNDRRDKTWKTRDANLSLIAEAKKSPQHVAEDLKLAKKVTSTKIRFDSYKKLQNSDEDFEVQQFENNGNKFKKQLRSRLEKGKKIYDHISVSKPFLSFFNSPSFYQNSPEKNHALFDKEKISKHNDLVMQQMNEY